MANPEHLELLRSGQQRWNDERPKKKPDLSGADLQGFNLNRFDLSECDLRGANLSHASLRHAVLNGASIEGGVFEHTVLREAQIHNSVFRLARLHYGNLQSVEGAADFQRAIIRGTSFESAKLAGSDFSNAQLFAVDFTAADLTKVHFNVCSMDRSRFIQTKLNETDFAGCRMEFATFALSVVSQAKNLSSIRHRGPSFIDAQTLLADHNLEPAFLKGIGVPSILLDFVESLARAGRPVEFHSCFISYSSKDEAFCRRLYTDLHANGVQCFFAPEDLKIGESFRARIEESIRVYDKLLVVLSENSLASAWVEDELEAALERDRSAGKTVLFPIRLDAAVMETSAAWAVNIRRSRHIGDFSRWKDDDEYQKAFERLLRDLKAS